MPLCDCIKLPSVDKDAQGIKLHKRAVYTAFCSRVRRYEAAYINQAKARSGIAAAS